MNRPRLTLRLALTLGAIEVRLRKRFPQLTWWLTPKPRRPKAATEQEASFPQPPGSIHPETVAKFTAELAAYFAEHGSDEVTRSRFAYRNWTISPDLEPDAPPTKHKFRCLGEDDDGKPCGAESQEYAAFEDARGWTFGHLKDQPEHTSYEQVMCRPWMMRPGEFL